MKAVKTMQKYKCEFCSKRSVKHAMELHEKRCYRNPNRFCDYCENKRFVIESVDHYQVKQNCPYCSRFNEKQLKEIEEREAGLINQPEL